MTKSAIVSARLAGSLLTLLILNACASAGDPATPRRQTVECPGSMILICEGRESEPSKGGDEEIPQYERCYCRARPI
jgi:hypothetical protein